MAVVSASWHWPVRRALTLYAVTAVFAALLLDGGRAARIVAVAILAHSLTTAVLVARRRHAPTAGDLAWTLWGFYATLLAVAAAATLFRG